MKKGSEGELNNSFASYQEIESQQRFLEEGNFRVLDGFGVRLIKILAQDASTASDLNRSVVNRILFDKQAFSTLDILITYDNKLQWSEFLYKSGFLAHFLDDLVSKQEQLLSLLNQESDSMRSLYVYESKLSLFLKISAYRVGCLSLMDIGLIRQLSECHFLDFIPQDSMIMNDHLNYNSKIPSLSQTYSQLLLPIVRVIVSMMTSIPNNQELFLQVTESCSTVRLSRLWTSIRIPYPRY